MNVQLSLCITCMGRRHHLEKTLADNITVCKKSGCAEVVLLDYSSPDKLGNWIKDEFMDPILVGVLSYYQAKGYSEFSRPHAKNIAHRVARGDIVCNLDADNFAGTGFPEYLLAQFVADRRVIVTAPFNGDAFGRITLRKTDFESLGGYDQRMSSGWGHEDTDLIERAVASGISRVLIPEGRGFLNALEHSAADRTRFHSVKNHLASQSLHRRISQHSIRTGAFVANRGLGWGSARLVKNFTESMEV